MKTVKVPTKTGEFQEKYQLNQVVYNALLTALDNTALVSETNEKGDIVFANQTFVDISKYSRSELLGQNHRILKSGDQPDSLFDNLWQTISSGKVWRGEIKNRAKDGSVYWVDTSIAPILGANGKPDRYISVRFLVTDKKLLESQRDDFIAIATHELKTPITSIKAYTQVLQRRFAQANDNSSAELLTKMDNQIDKLTKLVADLLDVSKIETGKLEFNMTSFSPSDLVDEVVEELSRTSDKHTIKVSGTVKEEVYGDKYRIGQVLSNLIENAIKYSPNGGKISLRLSTKGDRAMFSVSDNGVGIGRKDQKRVFERFFRTGENKVAPGFGLGLFISSEIVKNHQGELWVKSEKGAGSTFTFSLPLGGRAS